MKDHPIAAGVFLIVVASGIGTLASYGLQAGHDHERKAVKVELNKQLDDILDIARSGDYDTVIQRLEKMIEEHPSETGLYLNLGIAQRAAEKYDDADSTFAKVLEMDPNDYDALAERANIQKEKGNVDAAFDLLDKIPPRAGRIDVRLRDDPLWIDVADHPRMKDLRIKHGIETGTDTSLHMERMKKKGAPQGVVNP